MRQAHIICIRLIANCVLVLAGIEPACGQQPSQAIDRTFSELTAPGSPGCAVGAYRDGKIIFAKGYGLANVEENVPITPQTVFDVGSVSKQFTAASIVLLEKQGKLRLDEMEPPATFEAVEPPMLPTTELAAYVGDYWSEELRVTYRLALTNDKLWMKDLIGSDGIVHRGIIPSNELRPISAGDFGLNGAPLFFRFGRDEKGNLAGFVLNGFGERGILFTRLGKTK